MVSRRYLVFVVAAVVLALTLPACADPFNTDPPSSPTSTNSTNSAATDGTQSSGLVPVNRLSGATSAYLMAGADQPVAWQLFDDAAFDLARLLDRPILLDVGASSCHWCNVMEKESYGNAEIASFINDSFVPVKVDADERPDLDRRFQQAAQLLNQEAGWPLTLFLTPQGAPFAGGTYFGATALGGRPSLFDLLSKMAAAYQEQREGVEARGTQISDGVALLGDAGVVGAEIGPDLVSGIAKSLLGSFDMKHGGFGEGAKFPATQAIEFSLRYYRDSHDPQHLAVATRTLDAMAAGGIRDQLVGAFHRYTLDPAWRNPNFEIVGALNGALMIAYLHAYQATGEVRFRSVAEHIAQYLQDVLVDREQGGFYKGQNADVGPEDDGGYYKWTAEEVTAVLSPDEADVALRYYGLAPNAALLSRDGNPAGGRTALRAAEPIGRVATSLGLPTEVVRGRLESARARMIAVRNARPAPAVDRSFLSDRNGLLAGAFLEGYRIVGRLDWRDTGLRAVNRLMSLPRGDGLLAHSYAGGLPVSPGLLDDQVAVSAAFVEAFAVTGQRSYLLAARDLLDRTVAVFGDHQRGGFYDVAATPGIGVAGSRQHPYDDGLTLGGNPLAALTLDRYASLSVDFRYRDLAGETLRRFAGAALEYGVFASGYGLAVAEHIAAR